MSSSKKRRKKGKSAYNPLDPLGILHDLKILKFIRYNRDTSHPDHIFYAGKKKRFEDEVGFFMDYRGSVPISVHIIPATWTRVITYSLIYAICIALIKFALLLYFGKPRLVPANAQPQEMAQAFGH